MGPTSSSAPHQTNEPLEALLREQQQTNALLQQLLTLIAGAEAPRHGSRSA